jgi:hypothetical protein
MSFLAALHACFCPAVFEPAKRFEGKSQMQSFLAFKKIKMTLKKTFFNV